MNIMDLKCALRENGFSGDSWGISMSAMFDVCSRAYEKLGHYDWVSVNESWRFSPGACGNVIEESFLDFYGLSDATDRQLIDLGNYLNRLVRMLEHTGQSY